MASTLTLRTPARSAVAIAPMLAVTGSATLLIIIALAHDWYLAGSIRAVAAASVFSGAACLAVVVVQFRRHLWAFAPMLLLLICLFHLGLLFGPMVTGRFLLLSASSTAWVGTAEMRMAIWFVGMCVAAFTIGASLVRLVGGPEELRELVDDGFAASAAQVGSVVLVVSVISWFVLVVRLLGVHAFELSYLDYFEATHYSSISYANLGIGLGLVMLCLDPAAPLSRRALIVFGVFALASMSIGARSTTMFAAAAAATVLAYRVRMPRPALLVPLIALVISMLGLVRATRLRGLSGLRLEDVLISPFTGIAELGYTIRVVQTSFLWHGVNQEATANGATYLGWVARLFDSVVLGHTLPVADFRLMNVEISTRIGGLGGSILGEAHHNFGVIGGVVLSFFLGLLASWGSRAVRSTLGLALLGIVTVPIFIHVRNSFAPVLFTVCCGLIMISIALLVRRRGRASIP